MVLKQLHWQHFSSNDSVKKATECHGIKYSLHDAIAKSPTMLEACMWLNNYI